MVSLWRVSAAVCLVAAAAVVPASAAPPTAYRPAAEVSTADAAWVLTTHHFDNAFTAMPYVGNGYVGQRVPAAGMGFYKGSQGLNTWPLFNQRVTTGVVSGVYGNAMSLAGGYKQAIATIPAWTTLGFATPSGSYGPDTADASTVSDYTQSLDLRSGTVTTSGIWTAPGGQRTRFRYVIFTDRASAHIGTVDLTLTPLWSGTASVTATLDGAAAQRLTPQGATADTTTHTSEVSLTSTGVGTPLTEAQVLRAGGGVQPSENTGDAQASQGTATERMSFPVTSGTTYSFTKYAAIVSGRDASDPRSTALGEARAAANTGLPALARANAAAWQSVYSSDILVPGMPALQRIVHASEYSLYASLRSGAPGAVGPSGLGGEGYAGLVFWDADTWMFPALLLQHPDIAKVIPDYRSNTLAAAQRNATDHHYEGAFYPWTSAADGDYGTNCYGASCEQELHLQGDIALSFWQYYQATRDKTWLRSRGWPELSALAKFWESKAVKVSGGYAITGVQPPDEYQADVANSSYTNAVAALTLTHAADAAKVLGITPPAQWAAVARGLTATMPFDKARQIYKEYDGYGGGTIKQADVAMLTYPLGFPMTKTVAAGDLEYYAARTSPDGPAMSDAIHAIDSSQLGIAGCSAYTYLLRSYEPYVRSPYLQFSEVRTPDTLSSFSFLTGVSGFLQTFLYGFTGFRGGDGSVSFDPSLPPQLPRLTVRRMTWEGRTFTIDITRKHSTLTMLGGRPLLVKDPHGRRLLAKGKTLTVGTRRPAAQATSDLARCKAVRANSAAPGKAAVAAVDGSTATAWAPAAVASGQWLMTDLGTVRTVRTVTVRQASTYGYRIQVSKDGRSWRTVAAPAGAAGRTSTAFHAARAR